MKKTLAICALAVLLIALVTVPALAEAETGYRIAKENLTVYAPFRNLTQGETTETGLREAFTLPRTYYFTLTGKTLGAYTEIGYQGETLYLKTEDLESKTEPETKAVEKPFCTLDGFGLAEDSFVYYLDNSLTESSNTSMSLNKQDVKSVKFIGFSVIGGKNYFLLRLSFDVSVLDQTVSFDRYGYVSPAVTNAKDAALETVPVHPNSVPKDPVEPTPDPDGTINPGTDTPQPASNNLVRNVLIGVICVLCVIVIFLVFKPSKGRERRDS